MGFTPDFSAIKVVSKKNKEKKIRPKNKYDFIPKPEIAKSSSLIDKYDEKAYSAILKEDFSYLINTLVDEENEVVIMQNEDTALINEWKKQNIKDSLDTQVKNLSDLETLSKVDQVLDNQNTLVDNTIYDSDGDLNLSDLLKMNNSNIEQSELSKKIIYRDEDGIRVTRERWLDIQSQKKGGYKVKKVPEKKEKQIPVPWSKGIVQKYENEAINNLEQDILSRPFRETEIGSLYDQELKSRLHPDDPCYHMINTEKHNTLDKKGKPKCRFAPPPNRFGINPGYRWDGVVRSNGFEQLLLKERNKNVFDKENLMKWSIEDI